MTLNFGGVSLAADAGVSAQRMVEPEIADDGILLPPFGPLPEDVIRYVGRAPSINYRLNHSYASFCLLLCFVDQ